MFPPVWESSTPIWVMVPAAVLGTGKVMSERFWIPTVPFVSAGGENSISMRR